MVSRHGIAALVLMMLFLGGCGGGGSGNETQNNGGNNNDAQDTTPPTVIATAPEFDATNVALSSSITITFSEPMGASSLTTDTVTVDDGINYVSGSVAPSGASVTFTPATAFVAERTYTVTVTTGVQDAAGNPLAANYVWSFSTVSASGPALLFEKGGALYRVDEDGTHLSMVAPAPATFLGLSPAGEIIYRTSGIDLWSVNPDGTGRIQLEAVIAGSWVRLVGFTSAHRLVYSVDWNLSAYGDLYSVNADGSDPIALTHAGDVVVREDQLCVVDGRVVYLRDPSAAMIEERLYSVQGDGSGERLLVDATLDSHKAIVHVSAAGQVFFEEHHSSGADDDSDLYEVNADNTGAETVAASPEYREVFLGQAPNGRVAVGTCRLPCSGHLSDINRLQIGGTTIDLDRPVFDFGGFTADNYFVVQLDRLMYHTVGKEFAIRTISSSGFAEFETDPALASGFVVAHPDRRILYAATDVASGAGLGVFSASADGGLTASPIKLFDYGDEYLGIAPTGRIVFLHDGGLYSIDVDGMNRRLLRQPTQTIAFLGFSRGGKVLYAEHSPNGSDLFIVDHDGSEPVNLTKSPTAGTIAFIASLP